MKKILNLKGNCNEKTWKVTTVKHVYDWTSRANRASYHVGEVVHVVWESYRFNLKYEIHLNEFFMVFFFMVATYHTCDFKYNSL